MNLMFQPFRKYADFTGTATRKEYWLFTFFTFIVSSLFGVLDAMFSALLSNNQEEMASSVDSIPTSGSDWLPVITDAMYGSNIGSNIVNVLSLLFSLVVFIPSLAVWVRRLRDAGFGWWWIIVNTVATAFGAIMFIGGIFTAYQWDETGLAVGIMLVIGGLLLMIVATVWSIVQMVWPSKVVAKPE